MEPYPHRIPTAAENPALWANRDGQIIRASVVLVLLPTVFVALRLCSRWKAGAGFWVCLSQGPTCLNWQLTSRAVGRFERGTGNGAQDPEMREQSPALTGARFSLGASPSSIYLVRCSHCYISCAVSDSFRSIAYGFRASCRRALHARL